MKKFFVALYRRLFNYLNDSSALDTGSHRGAAHYCGLYSGLSEHDQERDKH